MIKTKVDIMYPEIIVYVLIALLLFRIYRRRVKYKKGVIVANTKYVKRTRLYKRIEKRYKLYSFLSKITCILLIIVCTIVTVRLYRQETQIIEKEKETVNAEILLCVEVGYSQQDTNLLASYIKLVNSLPNAKFGIVVYGMWLDYIAPFTTDHEYIISILNLLKDGASKGSGENASGAFKELIKGTDPSYLGYNEINRGPYPSHHIYGWIAECALYFREKSTVPKVMILDKPSCFCQDLVLIQYVKKILETKNISLYITSSVDVNIKSDPILDELEYHIPKMKTFFPKKLFVSDSITTYNQMVGDIVDNCNKIKVDDIKESREYLIRKEADIPNLFIKIMFFLTILLLLFEWRLGL